VLSNVYPALVRFLKNFLSSQGLYKWPNGALYDGEFVNGKREGQGKHSYSDGGQYIGAWKAGRRCGFGYVTTARWNGPWMSFSVIGETVLVWSDHLYRFPGLALSCYLLACSSSTHPFHLCYSWIVYSTYTSKDGRVYKGHWKMDKKHGPGTEYNRAGTIWYKGEWIYGSMNPS
jgi:hypothetical protein